MATLSSRRLEETAELGRALISGLPGAGLLIADTALRIQAVDGEIYDSPGYGHCVGRLISDVIPAAARADQAMYQAKQDGGDRVQLATGVPVAS